MASRATNAGTGTSDSEMRHASGFANASWRLLSLLGLITTFNRQPSTHPIETTWRTAEMRGNALEFALPGQW